MSRMLTTLVPRAGSMRLAGRRLRPLALLAAAIGAGLTPAPDLHAQAAARPSIAASAIAITPEQRSRIRRHVLAERRRSVATPAGFSASIGARVPDGVELFWMPPEAGLNRLRYAVVGDRALVVEPEARRVIEWVEAP